MLSIINRDKASEFEDLYFEHYQGLCQSTYRFVKDEDIVKDLVQEVFIKYWKNKDNIVFKESPIVYLRRSCVNQALNYLKEKERRDHRENVFGQEKNSSTTSNRPDKKVEFSELSDVVKRTIDQLPPSCREVFILSRYEGKSYKEIAVILQISVNTVEKHIGKSLKILRKVLAKR